MNEPKLTVGILFAPKIEFELQNEFVCNGLTVSGVQTVEYIHLHEKQSLNDLVEGGSSKVPPGGIWGYFSGTINYSTSYFSLPKMKKLIFLNWKMLLLVSIFTGNEKKISVLKGSLKIIAEDEKLTAINVISVEDYLTSVISSEMSATASLELLKAHAVISRSWVLKPIIPAPNP